MSAVAYGGDTLLPLPSIIERVSVKPIVLVHMVQKDENSALPILIHLNCRRSQKFVSSTVFSRFTGIFLVENLFRCISWW